MKRLLLMLQRLNQARHRDRLDTDSDFLIRYTSWIHVLRQVGRSPRGLVRGKCLCSMNDWIAMVLLFGGGFWETQMIHCLL